MPIFTPRGLKIRISVPYAFGLIARLYPKVSAFRVLKTTEGIELLPKIASFLTGILLFLLRAEDNVRYALAVPDSPAWEMQMRKIPEHIKTLLGLELWLVGEDKVRAI